MDLIRFREALYHILNKSDLPIASLMMAETDHQLLIEFRDGEKYEITIAPTDEFV